VNEGELPLVCLDRAIDLPEVQLSVRDWPGRAGPLVHVPDPLAPSSLIDGVASALAPRWRVLSVAANAEELAALLRLFGFDKPVLLGEGRGCLAPVLVAAWQMAPVESLVLADPRPELPPGLDWDALLAAVGCPLEALDAFLLRAAS
jgi:pimeloyl-ACP methyl ester carboxylesterase